MPTVLEEYATDEQHFIAFLFVCARDIYKETFHVYGGKCLSRKAVQNWVANVCLMKKRLKLMCENG
jgi:hypothetical protein